MSYEMLRHIDIDLGELGDSIQLDIDKANKYLRITLFQNNHFMDDIVVDLSDEFSDAVPHGIPPVLKTAGTNAVHPRYFGCPICGAEVGGFISAGRGEDDWSTHQDQFCGTCGHRIDWSKTEWSNIYRLDHSGGCH